MSWDDEASFPWGVVFLISFNHFVMPIHMSKSNECQFHVLLHSKRSLRISHIFFLFDTEFDIFIFLFIKLFIKLCIFFLNLFDCLFVLCLLESLSVILKIISYLCKLIHVNEFFYILFAKIDINYVVDLRFWKMLIRRLVNILFFFRITSSFSLDEFFKMLIQTSFQCIFIVFEFNISW